MPPHYGALAASPRRPAAPIDIRRLYDGTIVPALSCTPLGPRFAALFSEAPEGPTRAAACERELGGIWRAADWRRHVLEPRRRRGHALGKRPSLRALSGAASPPLVSLVCPPRPAVAQTQDLCPFTRFSRRAVAAAPLGLWPALPSARRPAEVLERAPRCWGGWVPCVLLALPVFGL